MNIKKYIIWLNKKIITIDFIKYVWRFFAGSKRIELSVLVVLNYIQAPNFIPNFID